MNITIFHVCEGLTAMPQPHESDSMLHHIREVAEADEAREIRGSRSIGNTGRHCPGRRFTTTGSSLMAGLRSPGATRRKAIDLARQALQVGDNDPGILANAAFELALFGEDIGAMIELADRALMLNPSFARGWYLSGVLRLFASKHDRDRAYRDLAAA
jgi:hypothetical protein